MAEEKDKISTSPAAGDSKTAPDNAVVKEIDIPNLKKKEKEKKKAGIAWEQGANGGGAFAGARGGAGAAASAMRGAAAAAARSGAGAAARLAAEAGAEAAGALGEGAAQAGLRGLLGQLSGRIAAFLATPMGKFAAAAAVAVVLAAGAGLLRGGRPQAAASAGSPDLGAIASTIKIGQSLDNGLGYAAKSAKGELKFEGPEKDAGAAAAPEASKAASGDAAKDEKGAKTTANHSDLDAGPSGNAMGCEELAKQGYPDACNKGPGMEHSYGKLSAGPGGDFGGNNIFSGGAPHFGTEGGKLGAFQNGMSRGTGTKGDLKSHVNLGNKAMAGHWRNGRALNSKALAQLRGMNKYNGAMQTRTGTNEVAATAGLTQFEGAEMSQNAQAPTSPLDTPPSPNHPGGLGTLTPTDPSACDTGACSGPQIDMGMVTTPIGNRQCTCSCPGGGGIVNGQCASLSGIDANQILTGLIQAAKQLKSQIEMMLVILAVLCAIGGWLIATRNWCTLVPIGVVIMIGATMMMMSIMNMCSQLASLGNQINSMPGSSHRGDTFKKAGPWYDVAGWVMVAGGWAGGIFPGAALIIGIVAAVIMVFSAIFANLG